MTMLATKTYGLALALLLAGCEMAEPIIADLPEEEALAGETPEAMPVPAMVAPVPAPAPTSAERPDTELTCTYPVGSEDTVETLRARYGDSVQVAELAGPEGETLPGVILWPEDPERRIEVAFTSERRDRVDFVRANAPSLWSVRNLRNGDSITRVQGINGAPFEFYGFGWDAGGNVSDFRGGEFERIGPCRVIMVLAYDYPVSQPPRSLVGDKPIMSDHPDIDELLVYVDEIGLAFDPEY
ncbi:hypothetical protein [Aurantiacibacter gilvus]|uniref:Lipoprotein n=1 Tax=Aurantiacibacter gilvus TaxID=3139141 RepID=A0ABU9IEV6_9SPHN